MFDNFNNLDYAIKQVLDFSIFNGFFAKEKQSMTDIDGICQRKDKFLIIEKKSGRGARLTLGQKILLEKLCEEGNKVVVNRTTKRYRVSDPLHLKVKVKVKDGRHGLYPFTKLITYCLV